MKYIIFEMVIIVSIIITILLVLKIAVIMRTIGELIIQMDEDRDNRRNRNPHYNYDVEDL
jgi:hypothetical protein